MNKHSTPIGAAAQDQPSCPTEAAGAPNRLNYSFRTTDCDTCGGHRFVTDIGDDGFVARHCGECERGQVDATCADCLVVKPLDDEGFCERCADASSLPLAEFAAKHYPHLDIGRAA